jgi:hypothetical protein
MRWLAILVVFGLGCTTEGNARIKRWPHHRQQGDARFAEIERRAAELEVRVKTLEELLARSLAAPPASQVPADKMPEHAPSMSGPP